MCRMFNVSVKLTPGANKLVSFSIRLNSQISFCVLYCQHCSFKTRIVFTLACLYNTKYLNANNIWRRTINYLTQKACLYRLLVCQRQSIAVVSYSSRLASKLSYLAHKIISLQCSQISFLCFTGEKTNVQGLIIKLIKPHA